MALKFTKKPPKPTATAVATVSQEHLESGKVAAEHHALEDTGIPSTAGGCEVGFEAGYTHNLGNFKSCRVGVSLKVSCPHGEIDEVYEIAKTWVSDRMDKAVTELVAE
jgi:hypothetical protein